MNWRPRSPLEVEEELQRLSDALDAATNAYATASREAGEAEADYRLAEARSFVGLANSGRKMTEKEKQHRALIAADEEYRMWKIKDALRASNAEHLRTLRTRIEALRTEAASRRFQG